MPSASSIVVHPGNEGRGIGKRLLGALIDWARLAPHVRKIELRGVAEVARPPRLGLRGDHLGALDVAIPQEEVAEEGDGALRYLDTVGRTPGGVRPRASVRLGDAD